MNLAVSNSFDTFKEYLAKEYSAGFLRRISQLSYLGVISGVLLDDIDFLVEKLAPNPKEFDESSVRSLLENPGHFADWMRSQETYNEYKDTSGNTYKLTDLPEEAKYLCKGHAALIRMRFQRQFLNEPSSGRAATCFETHLNYIIGDSKTLTDVQSTLILNLCQIVRERPLPALFLAHFVLQYLTEPQALRVILSASIWNKKRNVSRLIDYAEDIYKRLLSSTKDNINILCLGFSQSQIMLLKKLREHCNEERRFLHVIVPDVASSTINQSSIQDFLKEEGISVGIADIDAASKMDIDLALAGSKLISWSDNRKLDVVVDEVWSRYFFDLSRKRIRRGRDVGKIANAQARIPIVVTGGLFKFWPAYFRSYYKSRFIGKGDASFFQKNGLLNSGAIDCIATECGIIEPGELENGNFIDLIDDEETFERLFFFNTANDLDTVKTKDTAFDQIFGQFVNWNSEVHSVTQFRNRADDVTDLLFHYRDVLDQQYVDKFGGLIPFPENLETELKRKVLDVSSTRSEFDRTRVANDLEVRRFLRFNPEELLGVLKPLRDLLGESEDVSPKTVSAVAEGIYSRFREEGDKALCNGDYPLIGYFSASLMFLHYVSRNVDACEHRDRKGFSKLADEALLFVESRSAGFATAKSMETMVPR